jgi:hypothetical protein
MKKIVIGSLVGAILLFGWQSLSWTTMGIHDNAFQYASSQDTILANLQQNLNTDGQYLIPRLPAGSTHEEEEKFWKDREGKPWAVVSYHSAHHFDMVMPIVRGFLIALICVFLLCTIIQKFGHKRFGGIFYTAFVFGLVSFLFVWYNGHNWFETPWTVLTGEMIDCLVGWSLAGT